MILIPYILSALSGFFLIGLLSKNLRTHSISLHLALSIGIGMGLNGLLNFLILLFFGQYNQLLIASGAIILPFILGIIYFLQNRDNKIPLSPLKTKLNLPNILFVICSILLFLFVTFTANIHPYGEWDAWALWNMKLKFLLFGGTEWKNIFTQLHWSTQPDYPLLLPLMNITPVSFFSNTLIITPKTTAIVLTFSIGLIMFAGLKKFTPPFIALLGYLLLMTNAFFCFQSTSQYSDVLLGMYLLMSFVCISLTEKDNQPGYAACLGIILGFMTFTKNEGIVMAGLITFLFGLNCVLNKQLPLDQKKKILKLFFLFLGAALIPTIYFKLFLAPRNRDILTSSGFDQFKFFNWEGLMIIFKAYKKEFLHLHWSYLWIYCGILILLRCHHIFRREFRVLSLFLILYLTALTFIYLTTVNFDLNWRLNNTFSRILSYLLPSVLYYAVFLNYRLTNDSSQHEKSQQ